MRDRDAGFSRDDGVRRGRQALDRAANMDGHQHAALSRALIAERFGPTQRKAGPPSGGGDPVDHLSRATIRAGYAEPVDPRGGRQSLDEAGEGGDLEGGSSIAAAPAQPQHDAEPGRAAAPGLAEPELRELCAIIERALGQSAGDAEDEADGVRRRSAPGEAGSVAEAVPVYLSLDASMLADPMIKRALTLRLLEAAFRHYQIAGKTRGDLGRFYDAVAAYYGQSWFLTVDGEYDPPDQRIRDYVRKRIESGKTTVRSRAHNIGSLLDWYARHQERRARETRAFLRKLSESDYAGLAVVDFYIAHLNAPINLLNAAIGAANAPIAEVGGFRVPAIPKIPMQGEYGRKYQTSLELGAMLGFGLGAGAAGLFAKAGAAIDAQLAGLTINGVSVGPAVMLLGKSLLVGGSLLELQASAEGIADDLLLLEFGTVTEGDQTRTATLEEVQAALDRLRDNVLGAAGSAMVGLAAGREHGPAREPREANLPAEAKARERKPRRDREANPPTRRRGPRVEAGHVMVDRAHIKTRELTVDLASGTAEWILYDETSGSAFCLVHVEGHGKGPELVLTPKEPQRFGQNWNTDQPLPPDVLPLRADGFSFTEESLTQAQALYKKAFGREVPNLDGQIAWENKRNFQREYVRIRAQNDKLTPQQIGDLAIRRISFGKHRIKQGFTEISPRIEDLGPVKIDGVVHEKVPGATSPVIDVEAHRGGSR